MLQSAHDNSLCHVFPDYVRQAIVVLNADIKDYRIRQDSLDRLFVQIDADESRFGSAMEAVRQSLERTFQRLNCVAPAIHFEKFVPHDHRIKMRRIIRNFHSDLRSV